MSEDDQQQDVDGQQQDPDDQKQYLAEVISMLKKCSSFLSPEARRLLQKLLLDFWVRAKDGGLAVKDGDEEATIQSVREWARENGYEDSVNDDDDDDMTGATSTLVG